MSVAAIVETLSREFEIPREHAQRVHELLVSGYKAPYIARYRRAEVGAFTDGAIRRFARRLKQLEELELRRNSLLRSIEEQAKRESKVDPERTKTLNEKTVAALNACMDRFELEDHFLPHRRPEPEVQLAIDRGLEPLADLLVAPAPKSALSKSEEASEEEEEPEVEETLVEEPLAEAAAAPVSPHEEALDAPHGNGELEELHDETALDLEKDAVLVAEGDPPQSSEEHDVEPASDARSESPVPAHRSIFHATKVDLSPQLARLCTPFVNTDRGVHNEEQALEGAMRILSDRLGRNPELRTLLRRILRKHARVGVRALAEEGRLGRYRSLLRLNAPLRQLQGHRLIALRQAQAQRLLATTIHVDENLVLPKVRAALGKRIHPDYASVANEVARQALYQRLLPMIEDDTRNELRERADEEAIRFLAQQLRQVLLAPPAGQRSAAGVHVDAKGDWLIVVVDANGEPQGEEIKLEASALAVPELAQRLADSLRPSGVMALALGHGKSSRAALFKLREAINLLQVDACAFLVNETGVSGYANSEIARKELPQYTAPAREAISLARRFQDPLAELLKCDPKHLGLGREQSVVSKANLRRLIHESIESCVAHVGCDLNRAPVALLRNVPGLSYELASKLVARRQERPFSSREELRTESLLDDVTWTNAIGFLQVHESSEPLDRTALHPEQYDLARRVILQGGGSVEETLGQRDATKGLRRADFDVDDVTWRELMREISHPGRDPRPRLHFPRLLTPDVDPKSLEKDQVVEGLISNVASFGAFVDLGTARDAMIHISEISDHYVRDARALLSIGQVVRARVVGSSGPRLELSLKNVPEFRRRPYENRRPRPEREERAERRPRRERQETEAWSDYPPMMRAAQTRRDGLVTGRGRGERRKGTEGKRPARAGGGRPRSQGSSGRDEHYDPEAVRRASNTAGSYNPFASFFKKEKREEAPPSDPGPEGAPGGLQPAS